jgi:hypothetical protein
MTNTVSRRKFLAQTGAAGVGLTLTGISGATALQTEAAGSKEPLPPAKTLGIGFVGIGARGSDLLKVLLKLEGVQIKAVCDIIEDRATRAQRWAKEAGKGEPRTYTQGETDFRRLCLQDDLDLIITATPWKWHTPVCVAAMEAGKHAATEVPAAITLDECWQLVEASEKASRYCMMLENYCYFRNVMLVLNMVRKGLFGELLHCEGRTQENWLKENWHIFNSDGTLGWCGQQLASRNGNQYPTHGVGPMAIWANINRGDRFDHLVSMSSRSASLCISAAKSFSKEHALAKKQYNQGDANITLIRSANGTTFTLYFGGQSPQPWSPEHKVQGTKGTCIGEMFDQQGNGWLRANTYFGDGWRWELLSKYAQEYDHPLWKELAGKAEPFSAGNWSGAYDYLMLFQLTQALRKGQSPPMDVYDAAAWSAISELTERSAAGKSSTQEFPDFTRGKWKNATPTDLSQT